MEEASNKSYPWHLILILFISLIFSGVALFIYFNKIIGGLLVFIPIALQIIKKYTSISPIDNLIKRMFKTNKTIYLLCIALISIGVIAIVVNESNNWGNEKISFINIFGGVIWDERNEPLSEVIIFLPELNLTDTTDSQGRFYFENVDTNYSSITFIAYKEGYSTYEGEGSVGNSNFNFILRKK